ncbi:MAG: TetR/AcrR family transcriptional regulator [Brevinematales bacterium]|nr:TetR/AcrR family transcriptional regulator [Brevinematales bacterium]
MQEHPKDRIINAATILFTSKGYEKTKIEDIAEVAGITRMMVYYYFENKQDILKNIVKNLFNEALKKFEKVQITDLKNLTLINQIKEVLEEKKDFLAFIISEILRNNLKDFPIFLYLKEFYDKIIQILFKKIKQNIDPDIIYINLIFFHSLPLLSFFALKENISRELNINKEKIEKIFFERFLNLLEETIKKVEK